MDFSGSGKPFFLVLFFQAHPCVLCQRFQHQEQGMAFVTSLISVYL